MMYIYFCVGDEMRYHIYHFDFAIYYMPYIYVFCLPFTYSVVRYCTHTDNRYQNSSLIECGCKLLATCTLEGIGPPKLLMTREARCDLLKQ